MFNLISAYFFLSLLSFAFFLQSAECATLQKAVTTFGLPQLQPQSLTRIASNYILRHKQDVKSKTAEQLLVAQYIRNNAFAFFKMFRNSVATSNKRFALPVLPYIKTSPDERYLFASNEQETHIYELTDKEPVPIAQLEGRPMTVSHDSRYLLLFRKNTNNKNASGYDPSAAIFCIPTKRFLEGAEKCDPQKYIIINPDETVISFDATCTFSEDKEVAECEEKELIQALFQKSSPSSYIFDSNQTIAYQRKHFLDRISTSSEKVDLAGNLPFAFFMPESNITTPSGEPCSGIPWLAEYFKDELKKRKIVVDHNDFNAEILPFLSKGEFVEKLSLDESRNFITLSRNGRYALFKAQFSYFAIVDLLKLSSNKFCSIFNIPVKISRNANNNGFISPAEEIDYLTLSPDGNLALIILRIRHLAEDQQEGHHFTRDLSDPDVKECLKKTTKIFLFDLKSRDYFRLFKEQVIHFAGFSKEGNILVWADDEFEVITLEALNNLLSLKQAERIMELYKKTNPPQNTRLPQKDYEEFYSWLGLGLLHRDIWGDLCYYFGCRCKMTDDSAPKP